MVAVSAYGTRPLLQLVYLTTPNEDCEDDQELDGARDIQASAKREGAVVGRRVLVERVLYGDSGQAWE